MMLICIMNQLELKTQLIRLVVVEEPQKLSDSHHIN